MQIIRRFVHGIRDLVRRDANDRELGDELDAFQDASIAHKMRAGMSYDEARRAARLELGSGASVKDRVRDVSWESTIESVCRDLKYGSRALAKSRGFTAAAVITLGLGIGVATAVFSVVNAVLVEPLPYKDSNQLVRIVERAAPRIAGGPLLRRTGMRWSEMTEWRMRATTLSDLAITVSPPITLMPTSDGSARLSGALVSANVFSMLGANALLGRTLDARDDAAGSEVVVLSATAWQRYFHGDPEIIGRTVSLKTLGPEAGFLAGTPLTIVGVMPREFDFPVPYADFWAPITEDSPLRSWPGSGNVIARLRDGVSAQAAADEANSIGEALRPRPTSGPLARPLPAGVRRFDVEGIKEQTVAASRPALRALALAVGVVLLIVCANVAGLLLARGTGRHREIAIRLAIGAARGRVVRQLLTESFVLAAIGGSLGALFAVGGVHLLRELASPNAQGPFLISFGGAMVPRLHEIAVDGRMLTIAIALSAISALVVGALPAVTLSRIDHVQAMGFRGLGGQRGVLPADTRLRSVLVAGQLAMATTLLIGAGLLINSFGKLVRVDPGWNASGLLTFYLVMPQEYSTMRKGAQIEGLLGELRRMPAVQGAGFTYAGPLLGLIDQFGVFVPSGRSPDELRGNPSNPQIRSVSHDFLQTMGVRLLAGRWFDAADDASAPPVLIVNRTLVERFLESQDPVGQLVHLDGRMDFPPQRIIGVVEDMRQARLDQDPAPQMFVDYRQVLALTQARKLSTSEQERLAFGFLSFVVRTDGDPAALMPTMRSLVGRMDAGVGIDAMLPMEQLVASSLTRQRFYATMMALLAAIAAVLGAVGIYGVLAYGVARRTQEIGLRMALGAHRTAILRMVLRHGMMLAVIGIAVGVGGAVGLTRYLDGMLYEVTPLDPATYVAVAALFGVVTSLASYLPAHRATRIDPMAALRRD
jgi:predicted permease